MKAITGIIFAVFVCLSPRAHAVLGETLRSTKNSRGLAPQSKSEVSYRVQESETNGTTLREYVNSAGVVFGVSWEGVSQPDLSPIIGSYHAEYLNADRAKPRRRGQRSRAVRGDRVVVESWGHLRNMRGRAYLPEQLPAGVRADEIK